MNLNYIIILLIGVLVGYIFGIKTGRKSGFKEAREKIPLKLYENSIKKGRCILCEKKIYKKRNHNNNIE